MTAAISLETEQHQDHNTEDSIKKKKHKKSKKTKKRSKSATKEEGNGLDVTLPADDHEDSTSSLSDDKKVTKPKKDKKKKRSHETKSKDACSSETNNESARIDDAVMEDSRASVCSVKTTIDDDVSAFSNDNEVTHEQPQGDDEHDEEGGDDDECKIFLTRIPSKFNADSITRLFELSFGEGCIQRIALPLVRTDADDDKSEGGGGLIRGRDGKSMNLDRNHGEKGEDDEEGEHRGFAFVTMVSTTKRDEALEKGTIRGAVKPMSKKKHTMYIRSIVRNDHADGEEMVDGDGDGDGDSSGLNICYLWSKFRCPYGDKCKFKHVGDGGCITAGKRTDGTCRKKKQKCFAFQSKVGCKLGDKCPYSHDIDKKNKVTAPNVTVEKKDKDCINWKTKGKCRKKDTCPYRHDEKVRDAFLAKKRGPLENSTLGQQPSSKKRKANPQPLSVRVFGLNYDTKVSDIHEYFGHCGLIKEVTFPVYEDSGRSKGYCGILFTSPKATDKACELDGKELLGRWLSVQPGKMYLKQWAEREKVRLDCRKNAECVVVGNGDAATSVENLGEFGQKVKTRKKHGFKD